MTPSRVSRQTLASVRCCVLATRPGEKTRYSNVAPSIAGQLVERASGQSFGTTSATTCSVPWA